MKSIDKFLKEEWEIDGKLDGIDSWKHIHEFAFRYEDIESTCEGDHARSISILESMDYDKEEIDEIIEWFKEEGGHCDCEVNFNVVMNHYGTTGSVSTAE
jgi:hypothetical protein